MAKKPSKSDCFSSDDVDSLLLGELLINNNRLIVVCSSVDTTYGNEIMLVINFSFQFYFFDTI